MPRVRYKLNGREVSEAEFRKGASGKLDELFRSGGDVMTQSAAGWPYFDEAAGVHPTQIAEAQEVLKRSGVPGVEFSRHGAPKLMDRGHRRDVHRVLGLFDRSGGYGDAQRQ